MFSSSSSLASKYPYPSTINTKSFLSVNLSGSENYILWESQMECLLQSQQVSGFVNGKILIPFPGGSYDNVDEESEYMIWKRSDVLVKGWILGSLTENVLASVVGLSTASDVWEKLRLSYSPHAANKTTLALSSSASASASEHKSDHVYKYPYPSNINVANFLSIKLNRKNYGMWVRQIFSLVDIYDLGCFIWKPTPSEFVRSPIEDVSKISEDCKSWRRTDLLLRGWILGSICEELILMIAELPTSRDIMVRLEEIFVPDIMNHLVFEKDIPTMEGRGQKGYPYPSTVNVKDWVSMKLIASNYFAWAKQMLTFLDSQHLISFVMEPPPNSAHVSIWRMNEEWKCWRRTDLLVRGWILDSIGDEEVLSIVANMATSRDIFGKLEDTFVPEITKHIIFKKPIPQAHDISWYSPLLKATLAGNWEKAKRFMDRDRDAATAIITYFKQETIIHVAVGTKKAIHDFLKKLVEYLPIEALALRNSAGETALCKAAVIGNTEAAKILMNRDPTLLRIRDYNKFLPLDLAIQKGYRETALYFQSVGCDDDYAGQAGTSRLCELINVEYFDMALDLIKRYPHVATLEPQPPSVTIFKYEHPLTLIAGNELSFRSGNQLNFLENIIYSCAPLEFDYTLDGSSGGYFDTDNSTINSQVVTHFLAVYARLHAMLWGAIELLVPPVKNIRQKKLVHNQAVQLVKCLCQGIKSLDNMRSYSNLTSGAMIKAASLGIFQVVEEIVDIIPDSVWAIDDKYYGIAQLAVVNRCEKVFNLLYQMSDYRQFLMLISDNFGNNLMHLAGRLAPPHKLNLVSGAALQMQRELQWFQEVEKMLPAYFKEQTNSSKETPAMIFTREHAELVIAGEKWMKDTANSCTIAASLIITIVFAAAITVPGGNKGDTGFPMFYYKFAFQLFAISDAFSLFMATTSLLMFLSILTARYAEQDFLRALPKRLVLGLLTLFLSITSMIIAFTAAVYLVFGERNGWVLVPLAALSCLPISSFVTLQFPLLLDVFSSTYGRGIFGKQSDRQLY